MTQRRSLRSNTTVIYILKVTWLRKLSSLTVSVRLYIFLYLLQLHIINFQLTSLTCFTARPFEQKFAVRSFFNPEARLGIIYFLTLNVKSLIEREIDSE